MIGFPELPCSHMLVKKKTFRWSSMLNVNDLMHLMRAFLLAFEVCRQFQLAHETFALTVNTVDRYLSVRFVERDRLRLWYAMVLHTGFCIASTPTVFVFVHANACLP